MTTDTAENVQVKEKGRWFFFGAKIVFFLAIFLAVIISVLSALGGKSEVLKSSVEDFLGGRFGGLAKVETLNQMTFFPYLGADFEGLKITRRDNESIVLMSADHIVVAMGFWDVMFSRNKLKAFNIENLYALPGVVIEKGITIGRLAIIDEGDQAFVRGHGKIGSTPFTLETPINKYGAGKRKSFGFPEARQISGTFGELKFSGTMINPDNDTMQISDLKINYGGKANLSGHLDLYYGGEYRLKIKGELAMENGSKVYPDILLEMGGENPVASGTLGFLPLEYTDLTGYRDFIVLYESLKNALGRKDAAAFKGNIIIAAGNTELPANELAENIENAQIQSVGTVMLNCVLAEITLDNGIADISRFVMIAPGQSVTGTGQYNFETDALDLNAGGDLDARDLQDELMENATLPADHPCRGQSAQAE
jgi:hypothetical protein